VANGAPLRAITVKDSIGDLPVLGNGAWKANMEVCKIGKIIFIK